jgi:hypothetical protein
MSPEPVETQDHLERRERASGQEKTYVAEKLRGAAVMYGPSIVLDLFEGISVVAAAFGRLPNPRSGRAARVLRPIVAGGLKVGDFVPMAPMKWGVPMGGFTVVGIEPLRAILWRQGWPEDVAKLNPSEADSRGVWAFVLEEIDEGTTRLILRERSGLKPGMRDVILNYLFLERQHFVMVRRMLLGVKERAERARTTGLPREEGNHIEPDSLQSMRGGANFPPSESSGNAF